MANLPVLSAIICTFGLIAWQPFALAQFQTAPVYGNGYELQEQRKMAPNPQVHSRRARMMQAYDRSMASRTTSNDDYNGYSQQSQAYGTESPKSNSKRMQYGGAATSMEPQYPPMPFDWGYDIKDGYGNSQFHKEKNDEYGKRTGSYGYTDAYGVYRRVYYVADENGFRASIKSNEPGTSDDDPADVEIEAEEPPANVYTGNKGYGYSSAASPSSSSSYGASRVGSMRTGSDPSGGYGQIRGRSSGPMEAQQYAGSSSPSMGMAGQYAGGQGMTGMSGKYGSMPGSGNGYKSKQGSQYADATSMEAGGQQGYDDESNGMGPLGYMWPSEGRQIQQQQYGSQTDDSFGASASQRYGKASSMANAQEYGTNSINSGSSAYMGPASGQQESTLDYRKAAGRKIAALMRQRNH